MHLAAKDHWYSRPIQDQFDAIDELLVENSPRGMVGGMSMEVEYLMVDRVEDKLDLVSLDSTKRVSSELVLVSLRMVLDI